MKKHDVLPSAPKEGKRFQGRQKVSRKAKGLFEP